VNFLVRIYLEVVRPSVELAPPKPDDYFFLKRNGVRDTRICRLFITFFAGFGLHLGTNMVRSIVETRADELESRNLITVSKLIIVLYMTLVYILYRFVLTHTYSLFN
jgi:hypothetical protein